jgi:hypothetical protein
MSNTEMIENNQALMRDRLTLKEACEYLDVPIATLRFFRASNKGPASYRLAGKVQYSRAELDRWVAAEMAATMRGGV